MATEQTDLVWVAVLPQRLQAAPPAMHTPPLAAVGPSSQEREQREHNTVHMGVARRARDQRS